MDIPDSIGRKRLAEIADVVSMIRPPEKEAEYLLKICQHDALKVAEECLEIMAAELETEEVTNYWRKVCDYLRPRLVLH